MLTALSRRNFLKTVGLAAATPFAGGTLLADSPVNGAAARHRIMTCNILLDLPEQKGTAEDWSAKRRDVCIKVIKAQHPDIVCLQEVGAGQNDDFVRAFPGFTAFGYVDPYTDKHPRRFQAAKNVIIYSNERYEQTSAGLYWLSETPLIAGSRLPHDGLPRHVTWVRLKDRASQKQFRQDVAAGILPAVEPGVSPGGEFRVLCTHWTLKQPLREREARILTTEAGSPYTPDFPQLLAGDFNSESGSPEHKLLTAAGWKDTYEPLHPDFARANPKPRKIDYIYFHGQVKPIAAEIINEQENGIHPSDHPFVMAGVVIA
ncbi:MAG: endonuclease/exonuclease/phosphatase family protein [Limisphaerales bacterium]